ncbi:MAG: carboxypeptidase regulatory-like domain-containing protein [Armatimonadetes bacterium]|nr:carboxypeptidase regulatory-like domain-containing protein [Armatimonadota bacterium]
MISGLITAAGDGVVVGAAVGLYQGAALQAWTLSGADGRYTFAGVPDGNYQVRAFSTTMTFDPGFHAVVAPPGTTTADFVGSYFIAGHVRTSSGDPIPNVTVRLYKDSALQVSAVTDANGRYYFIRLTNGLYTVTPDPTYHVFNPVSQDVPVPTGSNATDFVATAYTSVISGSLQTAAGDPLAGVTVKLFAGAVEKGSTTSDAAGGYSFTNVPDGNYIVRPYSSTVSFDPATRAVSTPPGSATADFVGGYCIAGALRTAGGAPIPGVSVGLYQDSTLKVSAVTDANGRYYFLRVTNGNYTVTPESANYTFAPVSQDVTVPIGSNATDFVGTANAGTIAGVLQTAEGDPLAGVTVQLFAGAVEKGSTTSDAEGRYAFTNLADDNYTVRPYSGTVSFDPATRAVSTPPGSLTADFVGKCFIAGHVRTLAGAPIPNVTVGLYQGGILKVSSLTDANGRYYFINLATGSYTVQPTPNGHVFSPEYRVVAVPPGSSTTDFIGTGSTSTISGVIRTAGGAPIFGMSVRLYQGADLKATVSTNSEGRYTFSGVPYGSYTVQPISSVTAFNPATRDVTIPPDATDVDFTGSYALIGTVKTAAGAPVAGVTVGLYQGETLLVTSLTDANGRFYFLHVEPGDYTVKPTVAGPTYSPSVYPVTVPPGHADLHFIQTAP